MLWVCSEYAAHISTKPYFTGFHSFLNDNPEADENLVDKAISQLPSIKSCQLGAIILVPQLDIS